MLVDVEVLPEIVDKRNASVLIAIAAGPMEVKRLSLGLYQINHFSFDLICKTQVYEVLDGIDNVDSEYGICDSPAQFMAKFGYYLTESKRCFCVSFTEIRKEDQPREGGWRWRKWEPYVGVCERMADYLYDEPLIDRVFRYKIYEVLR